MLEGLQNLYLLVAGDCNLTCSYCYAKRGSFGGSSRAMSPDTMRVALEKLMPGNGSLVVSFFGGEPLLELDLLQQTVTWADALGTRRNTRLRYVVTTNGTLMDDKHLAFLKAYVSHIAVSLDGGPALTDTSRRFTAGEGSVHHAVVQNLARLKQAGIPFGLRGTIPEGRGEELAEAMAHLECLGPASVRVEAADGAKPWSKEHWRIWTEGVCQLNQSAMTRILAGKRPVRAGEIIRVAKHRLAGLKWHYPCAAGQGILAVSTSGDVYPCDHFIGTPAFRMGNVHQDEFPGEDYYRIAERLQLNEVDERPKCANCRVRHLCGGECPVRSLQQESDIAAPSPNHCTHTRRVLRHAEGLVDEALADPTGRQRIVAFAKGGSDGGAH